jgi:HAD superfamily hydrolase (TIGR01484 family)
MPFVKVKDLGEYLKDGAYKVQIISLDNYELLKEVEKEILCKLGDEVEAVFSNSRYLEILPKGIGKGISVKRVASLLSMPMSHTFAAGDAENDISMIKAAGTGIAMANATDEVKSAADIITQKTNNEDGLIEIIDKYFS